MRRGLELVEAVGVCKRIGVDDVALFCPNCYAPPESVCAQHWSVVCVVGELSLI